MYVRIHHTPNSSSWVAAHKEYCPRCKKRNGEWVMTCGGPTNAMFYFCAKCKVYFRVIFNPVACLGCKKCGFDTSIYRHGNHKVIDKP